MYGSVNVFEDGENESQTAYPREMVAGGKSLLKKGEFNSTMHVAK